jgi:hypothetical protein
LDLPKARVVDLDTGLDETAGGRTLKHQGIHFHSLQAPLHPASKEYSNIVMRSRSAGCSANHQLIARAVYLMFTNMVVTIGAGMCMSIVDATQTANAITRQSQSPRSVSAVGYLDTVFNLPLPTWRMSHSGVPGASCGPIC